MTPVSSNRNSAQYPFTYLSIFQLAIMDTTNRMVVSRMRGMLMPSIPKK